MARIGREKMFMDICDVVAQRSTCFRQNVGALIVQDRNIISMGYNGAAPGAEHCLGNQCSLTASGGCERSHHAEENAITRLPRITTGVLHLYSSLSPCIDCATRIIDCRPIKNVYYRQAYRVKDGLIALMTHGIKVARVTASGYVIDEESNNIIGE